jgi:hypothetical protein
MTTLKIEEHDAVRLIATILREDLSLQPARANEIASKICTRISVGMLDLRRAGYGAGWRAVRRYPPYGEATVELVAKLRERLPQADKETLNFVWEMVYEHGSEVPDSVMPRL